MAQFSHADFGGMSQWSPGMSMVGDMFNTQLKAKLDAPRPGDVVGARAAGEQAVVTDRVSVGGGRATSAASCRRF
jgi:hypothetical protein